MSRRRAKHRPPPVRRPLPQRRPPEDLADVALAEPVSVDVYPRPVTPAEIGADRDDIRLTADLAEALRKIPSCQHCGGRHTRACPRIRRMSFHPNGALAAVEFWPAGKWPDDDVIWPEALETTE